jgi:hypothetical protein
VREMEACWPSGVALRGEASNHPVLRWLKTVVVSDRETARRDRVRWGSGRRSRDARSGRPERAFAVEAPKAVEVASKPGISLVLGMSLAGARVPGQAVPGVEAA